MPFASMIPAQLRGPLLLVLGGTCVGMAPIGLRLSELEPVATAFWRFTLALPLLLAFGAVRKFPISRPTLPLILTGVFFALDMWIWHTALVHTSVANATFLVNLGAIGLGLAAWIVIRVRPAPIWPLAAGLATIGAAIMSFGGNNIGNNSIFGDILAIGAAFCVSGYLMSAAIARKTANGFAVATWLTIAAIPVSAIGTLIMGENIIPPDIKSLGAPLFLALIAQCAGQGLIVTGMGMTAPSLGGVLLLAQPVVAALVAWPLFKEPLIPLQILGAGFILFGIWLAGRSASKTG